MNKIAVVDIDNTLWQFCDPFYQTLKTINKDFPAPDKWVTPDIWERYCSEDDFMDAINSIHRNQDSDACKPYPESQDFLTSLKENGYYIIVASHRVPEMREPTERWLKRYNLPYDELHLSLDKTVLFSTADVVVDDSAPTLKKAVESGALAAGLLFPWNKVYTGNGFGLFNNLNEVLAYILIVNSSIGPSP